MMPVNTQINFQRFLEVLIQGGMKSVVESFKDNALKREASIEGFQLASHCESFEQLEALCEQRRKADENKREDVQFQLIQSHEYWWHRWATLQIEYVYDVCRVGFDSNKNNLSARACLRYAEIMRSL